MTNAFDARNEHLTPKQDNNTGLPDRLKSGVETHSGYAMDDVKVHYSSARPAQLQAHAYAEGSDIYLASGQEHHLPHEAWHVVQQKQGRVTANRYYKKHKINDDKTLEKEADLMGKSALDTKVSKEKNRFLPGELSGVYAEPRRANVGGGQAVLQATWFDLNMNRYADNQPKPKGWVMHTAGAAGEIWGPPQSSSTSSTSQTSDTSQSLSRTQTGNRRDYWEGKVSAQAKEVCRLLGHDWWDLMPASSPHLTTGTGQGGAQGHENRDGKILNELKQNAAKIFEKRKGVVATEWGKMLDHLKTKESKEEKEERDDLDEELERTQEYQQSLKKQSTVSAQQEKLKEFGGIKEKAIKKRESEKEKKQKEKDKKKQDAFGTLKGWFLKDSEAREHMDSYAQYERENGKPPPNKRALTDFEDEKQKKSSSSSKKPTGGNKKKKGK
jgi:hypothetical protein